MARIRSIKPEFWTDSFMVQLPHMARLLYIALWSAADDHGYINDEPERLAMELMPREAASSVDDFIQLFHVAGRLEMFADEFGTYYRVAKWEAHQRVDRPSKSRIARESSRKVAISNELRREIARKYGCDAGGVVEASCYYCGAGGGVHWHKLSDGRPSGWVTFPSLEIEHLDAEFTGGKTSIENMVLACRNCNRSKGSKHWIEAVAIRDIDNPRECSRVFAVGKEQGTGKGKEQEQEGSEPKGSGASAPATIIPIVKDARKELFDEVLPMLAQYVGKTVPQLRGLCGKWLQASGDDALTVSRTVLRAITEQKADAIAWIERQFKPADPDEAIYRGAQVMA